MAKKHPSPSARMLLEGMYKKQGQGVEPGSPLCIAMHEFQEDMGLSNPRLTLVQNLGTTTVDFIEPGAYGLSHSHHKLLKPVAVEKKEASE